MSDPDSTPKSLHRLCVDNPRFAVTPLFWTSQHLAAVNCSFRLVDDIHGDDVKPRHDHDDYLDKCAEKLATSTRAHMKPFWLDETLLRPDGCLSYDTDIVTFCFAKRRIFQVEPIIGFYHYNVDRERQNMLQVKPAPRGQINNPVKRLYDHKIRRVTPPDWRNDPYIVCLLLTMAQDSWRTSQRTGSYPTRLLITHQSDQTNAYVFKADIPYQLLKSLDNPKRSMNDFAFPLINYTPIPFQPYSTFSERIEIHLLGPKHPSLPLPTQPRCEKRKCGILDETTRKVKKLV
ncbi:uncharacterized protein QYS62_011440 [Fusarium acuminatum]|uniref:Uncharacterized protein n=1 Tax=Fusarium acuminatum TaxID=5515 RepID=A0ABZ2XBZ8_9HYPO